MSATRGLGLVMGTLLLGVGTPARAEFDEFKVFKPEPGRDVVKPMKPDWCGGYKGEDHSGCDDHCVERKLGSFVRQLTGGIGEWGLPLIAGLACDFPNNADVQKQVAYYRQSWINYTGLSEKDDREALKLYAAHPDLNKLQEESCAKLTDAPRSQSAQGRQKYAIIQALCTKDRLGRGSSMTAAESPLDNLLSLERPDQRVSEIARAWYLVHGLPSYEPKRDDFSMMRHEAGEVYPLLSLLISRMDRKALDAEIAALGLTGLLRGRAIVLFGDAMNMAKTWGELVREDAKRDPAMTKAIEGAERAFTDWSKVYQDHKAALDLAYAVEDKMMALSDKARFDQPNAIGCEELRKTFKEYLVGQKRKTKDDVKSAATDVVGYPLFSRLILCDAVEGRWADAAAEREILKSGRFAAGPYTAAFWSLADSGVTVRKHPDFSSDVVSAAITWTLNNRFDSVSTLNEVYDGKGGVSEEDYRANGHMIEQGRVGAVKKSKDGIEVSFKKEKWSEPDFKCTNSGRISQYERDGTPVYISHCVMAGSHVVEFQLDPRVFTDRSAADVKVGQIIKVVTLRKRGEKGPPPSFLLETDAPAPAKGKKPPEAVSYFGIKLGG